MITVQIVPYIFLCLTLKLANCQVMERKPNIVIIFADDLGFSDVSFHGSSEIPTPNIDALCYNGVILNRMYTTPLCTPSRSSLMTGKYSTKLGMQHFVIPSDEPWGLPLNEKIMPEYFRDAGYKTALVGKWHLGFYERAFTPTMRGFDHHFGYLGPYIGYFDHSLIMLDRNYSRGYDMRRNLDVVDGKGKYATDLFTDEAVNLIKEHDANKPLFMLLSHLAPHTGNEDKPLEAPERNIGKFSHIKSEKRRTLAAMIDVLDEGIGKVVEALNEKGLMNNTVIFFLSDNGGPTIGLHSTMASNYPLRGQKGGVWEGGVRVPACMYHSSIGGDARISNEFMHITDLLPTMASMANISIDVKNIDGIDQREMILKRKPTTRRDILYNIESVFGFSAIMSDNWKLVNGTENIKYSGWLGSVENYYHMNNETYFQAVANSRASRNFPSLSMENVAELRDNATVRCPNDIPTTKCNPLESPCLFNVVDDPCEMNNLAQNNPEIVEMLLKKLEKQILMMKPSIRKEPDPLCDPKLHNGTWTWWKENDDKTSEWNTVLVALCIICIIGSIFLCFIKCKKIMQKMHNVKAF